jgi:formate-dependent nitrite reductase membrane component NrfD
VTGAGAGDGAPMPRSEAHEAREHLDAALLDERRRAEEAAEGRRDPSPALGTPAEPARWRRALAGARVALHDGAWQEARWSYLYSGDSEYAKPGEPPPAEIEEAARDARTGDPPPVVQGPVMKPPVWTWEVPLYFWFGGMAAGSAFVGFACEVAGDPRSARAARIVSLAAVAPSPVLLILDLGRPERFYNMLRIFKPRSPMSMGAWCLTTFGTFAAGAVGADLLGRPRLARALNGVNALLGGYLGSYAGVLLACTAVPVWARSKLFLGPIFVATATATGAAATRLVLVAIGVPRGHPTRLALDRVEAGAMLGELALSEINERRLGRLATVLSEGGTGRMFQAAKWLARGGLVLEAVRGRLADPAKNAASGVYLAATLLFRYAWVGVGKPSARDDEAVARMARARATAGEPEPETPVKVVHSPEASGAESLTD